jgi:hypothetical protein
MTEETPPTATTKKQTTRKTAGRKPGQKVYSQKQRGVALSIIDLFDGNVARAALATGIERKTLFKWRDEMEPGAEFEQVRTEESAGVVVVLNRLMEALCANVLMKAQDASMRDLYYLMGIILDKIENHKKLALLERAQLGKEIPSTIPELKPLQLSASVKSEQEKARWEEIVEQVIFRERKLPSVGAIISVNPQAKEYLTEECEN